MTLKVFLCGEGSNDLGTRPEGDELGVVETLLRRVRETGWNVSGAMLWKEIRKYRAGAAKLRSDHADAHNVRALVQRAYADSCEVLAFVRDVDGETERGRAILHAIETIDELGLADDYRYQLAIIGGVAKPTLEAWILHLRGVANTDDMTKEGAARRLAALGIELKRVPDYVEVAATCALPTGHGSLCDWLKLARTTFNRLIDGTPAT